MRTATLVAACAGGMLLAACGSGESTPPSASFPAPTSPPGINTPGSQFPADPYRISGFGAFEVLWNVEHQLDSAQSCGCAYVPILSDGRDTFAAVTVASSSGDRVIGYVFNQTVMSVAALRALVKQQLPHDAQLTGTAVNAGATPGCQIDEFQSPTLGQALSSSNLGDAQGYVKVVYESPGASSGQPYNAQQVDQATLSIGGGPSDLHAGC